MYRSVLRVPARSLLPVAALTTAFQLTRQQSLSCAPKPPEKMPHLDILIFQYNICPFCNRVKAYLDFLGLPYRTVEVNPIFKTEIEFVEEPRKVPVVVLDGDVTRDSEKVIKRVNDALLAKGADPRFLANLSPPDTGKWMDWSAEQLAVKIYPNITRNFSESWQAFEYTSAVSTWPWYQRYLNRVAGPVAMFFANGKIKKKYNIIDERAELVATVKEWTVAVGNKKFLHGDSITMPDIMVYGVLKSVKGFDTFNEIMQDQDLSAWYQRVDAEVETRRAK